MALLCLLAPAAHAQPAPQNAGAVKLNLPDNAELRLLIDYVSQRLGVKILYDQTDVNKRITVKAPEQIPADSLLQVLESVLKIQGLALVDADAPGWKQIVKIDKASELLTIARPGINPPLEGVLPTEAITQAFRVQHVTPKRLAEIIKPFLTEPGANTLVLDDQNVLIVTDYRPNLQKIDQLVKTVDRAGPEAILRYYKVKHVDAPALQKQINQVLTSRQGGEKAIGSVSRLQVTPDERTNQLVLIGTADQVEEAVGIAEALDVPLGQRTEVYEFRFVEADRVDRLVQDLFDELTIKRLYRSAIDAEENLLIATATEPIHKRIAWLAKRLDVEAQRPGSAIQFYRLKFANAVEILQTIQAVQSGAAPQDFGFARGVTPIGRGRFNNNQYTNRAGFQGRFVPGANQPYTPGAIEPTLPPGYVAPPSQAVNGQPAPVSQGVGQQAEQQDQIGLLAGARISADAATNSIIVVADRATQEVCKNLIEFLDRRRPQVMIEAKVVIIDTSDSYALGVELSTGDRSGFDRVFEFTSFGLSTVDPTNGFLSLTPGRGLNFALINRTEADAILQALTTHSRAKVISAPRILVNDNATGTLASVAEVPFTSLNASDTVATTSFAGFAEAGTTIEVTPRISEGDFVNLDYVVTLNSFTGTGGDGVPPPRTTDEIASQVTVPDGYTVVVGGLNNQTRASDISGVPYIEKIPLLRLLSSIETNSTNETTLFVFLRPAILRDDKFADLKYLSDVDLKQAQVPGNFPKSGPVLIRSAPGP